MVLDAQTPAASQRIESAVAEVTNSAFKTIDLSYRSLPHWHRKSASLGGYAHAHQARVARQAGFRAVNAAYV